MEIQKKVVLEQDLVGLMLLAQREKKFNLKVSFFFYLMQSMNHFLAQSITKQWRNSISNLLILVLLWVAMKFYIRSFKLIPIWKRLLPSFTKRSYAFCIFSPCRIDLIRSSIFLVCPGTL